jgi:nucleoside-diphosphate-sugar epimerase
MKCVVTGAAGCIGSALSERLFAAGHDVFGVGAVMGFHPHRMKKANTAATIHNDHLQLVEGDLSQLHNEPIRHSASVNMGSGSRSTGARDGGQG